MYVTTSIEKCGHEIGREEYMGGLRGRKGKCVLIYYNL